MLSRSPWYESTYHAPARSRMARARPDASGQLTAAEIMKWILDVGHYVLAAAGNAKALLQEDAPVRPLFVEGYPRASTRVVAIAWAFTDEQLCERIILSVLPRQQQ